MHQPPPGGQREDPLQTGTQHAGRVRLDHVVNAEIAPHLLDGIDGVPEVGGVRSKRDGAHRSGGGAGDHLKRASGAAAQLLGDALEHADLVCRARAAAGQDQAENRFVGLLQHRIH